MSDGVLTRSEKKLFYGYINLAAVWVIYFINVGLILYGTSGLNSAMVSSKGFNAATIGLAISICTVMQGVTGAALGFMIDRKGVRFPFALGSILILIGGLLISFFTVKELYFVILYGLIVGSGMGLGGIVTTQSTINIWFNKNKPMAMAIALSAGGIGGFLAPIILEFLIGMGSWTFGWIFIAASSVISLFLSIFIVKNKPSDIGDVPDGMYFESKKSDIKKLNPSDNIPKLSIKEILSNFPFYHIIYNSASRNILYYAVIGHIVIFVVNNGMPREKAVLVISIMSILSLLGRFLFGALCQGILKPKIGLSFGNVIMAFGVLLIMFMPTNHLFIYSGGALVGIGLGAGYIATPLIYADYLGNINFPMVMGASSPINYSISALGPLIAGYVATASGSYILTFIIMSIISISGGITILFSKPLSI